ncbi:MAG TPA: c-type cytochrome [Edaphobacter sp.]
MKHSGPTSALFSAAIFASLSVWPVALKAQAAKHPHRAEDWPVTGGQPSDDRYSPLTQINRSNVKDLQVAWQYDTGEKGQIETTPIVVDSVLYGATTKQSVFALDAASGKQLWRFDPHVRSGQPIRGVTYWKDGAKGRILAGIMQYMYQLDAKTGEPVKTFGDNGRIDLRNDLDDDPSKLAVSMTSPGVVYGDLIIVGFRAPETHPAPRGDIRAYDLHTGKLRWTFHTIPHPGEPGYETWPKDGWKTAGAANNWAGMTLDPVRGIVYVPTGSAVDDFYGGDRLGNNLFADCLLALDAKTGKLLWYFQGVHHDLWDRDFPAPPVLLTVKRDGKSIDAVAQTSKQGFVYVFDRVTGKSLFPITELSYPQSTVPGEVTSPTQPLPLAPEPFSRQILTDDMLTTRTPESHAWALKEFHNSVSAGQFIPFNTHNQTIVVPGFDGGAEWGGAAVDRKTGVLYVNANNVAYTGGLEETKPTRGIGASTYMNQCAVCHGSERKGSPPEFPTLIGISQRVSDTQIETLIHNGKGRMPSFPNVKDARLHALLEYLRTGEDIAGPNAVAEADLPVHTAARGLPGEDKIGAAAYARHCAICHGDDISGIQPGFPSLVGVGQRLETKQVLDIVQNGKGRMPGFAHLPKADTEALLRYLAADDLATTQPATAIAEKRELEAASDYQPRFRFTGYRVFLGPDGYPAVAPPWGTLNAIDLNTGKYLWKIPFGEYPELAASGWGNTGTQNYGGPVVTAGGLVFIAATVFDRKMHAYDSRTGKLLWEYEMPFGGLASSATYMVDGRQFVVVAAGGGKDEHHPLGGLYMAFALPQDKKPK